MTLTKDKLKSLWEKEYYSKSNEVKERFDKFYDILGEINQIKDAELKPFYYNIEIGRASCRERV